MEFQGRISVVGTLFTLFTFLIISRLFYWQIIKGPQMSALAVSQREKVEAIPYQRGSIYASDNSPLVSNKNSYFLFTDPSKISQPSDQIAKLLAPILVDKTKATESSLLESEIKTTQEQLTKSLSDKSKSWYGIKHRISLSEKEEIEKLQIKNLSFNEEVVRFYPEASMAAHTIGFVGSDFSGEPTGYFGLEGFYDLELKGRAGRLVQEKDVFNKPILTGLFETEEQSDGKDLILFLDRTVQSIVEESLKDGLKKYGAKSGWVVVMDPKTGAILAMASQPSYDPANFQDYEQNLYKNPVISEAYEPGSTFKVLVMSAALNEKVVTPETRCTICDGPYKVDKYYINTWNHKYYPNQTLTEVLEHSDNVGMVFVSQKLGKEKMLDYLDKFGIGKKTGIDLQDEASIPLKNSEEWSIVDTSTASFGQGLVVTGIQMIRAVSAIANGGMLVEPHMASKIVGENKSLEIKPKTAEKFLSSEAISDITHMMVEAVDKGEAKWAKPAGFQIAGKTGTAQIPVSGHYDETKTIASFVGFAPANNPKFIILTYLREPTSSPWGSETAAPLFFQIAKKLLIYYDIQPDK